MVKIFPKRAVIYSVLVSCTVLAACKKEAPPAPPLPPVEVQTVHRHPVQLQTVLPGRLSAIEQAQIRPQVSGVITSRDFEQGKDVEKGQSLYHIFVKPYQAALDQARGALEQAEAQAFKANSQYERYKKLRVTHAVSEQEYDNARSAARQAAGAVATAKGQLASAEVNMEYSKVISPISGRIGRMIYTPGTLVTAGQQLPIAIVTRLDPIYVDVNMAAEDLLRLREAVAAGRVEKAGDNEAAVEIDLPGDRVYKHKGKLELAEPTVAPDTGTFVLRAIIPNPEKLLMPGMFVRARVFEATDPRAILISQASVMRDARGDAFVYALDDRNQVVRKPLELGRMIGSNWLVNSGLEDGDRVLLSGLQKVRPGQKVNPTDEDDASVASSSGQA